MKKKTIKKEMKTNTTMLYAPFRFPAINLIYGHLKRSIKKQYEREKKFYDTTW